MIIRKLALDEPGDFELLVLHVKQLYAELFGPICLATLAESFSFFARGHYGIINELWVRSDARSRGAGARMIEHCAELGRKRGWRRIDVSAPADSKWDRSFEFYRKRGFLLTGRKLKYMIE